MASVLSTSLNQNLLKAHKAEIHILGIKPSLVKLILFCLEVLLLQTLPCLQHLWFEVDPSFSGFPSRRWWSISLMWYCFNRLLKQTIEVTHCTMELHCSTDTRCVVMGNQPLKVSITSMWNCFSRVKKLGTVWERVEPLRIRACGSEPFLPFPPAQVIHWL